VVRDSYVMWYRCGITTVITVIFLLLFGTAHAGSIDQYCFTNNLGRSVHAWALETDLDKDFLPGIRDCFYIWRDDPLDREVYYIFKFEAVDYKTRYKIMEDTYVSKRWYKWVDLKQGDYTIFYENDMIGVK